MDNSPLSNPLIEVSRSFSRKIQTEHRYESADFFCAVKSQCMAADFEAASAYIYALCKREVLKSIAEYRQNGDSLMESVSGLSEAVPEGPPPGFSDPHGAEERAAAKAMAQAVAQQRIAEEQEKLQTIQTIQTIQTQQQENGGERNPSLIATEDRSGETTTAAASGNEREIPPSTTHGLMESRPEEAKSAVPASTEFSPPRQPESDKAGKAPAKRGRPRKEVTVEEALAAAKAGELGPTAKIENPVSGSAYVATDDDVPAIISTPKYASPTEEVERGIALIVAGTSSKKDPYEITKICNGFIRGYWSTSGHQQTPTVDEKNIRMFRLILKFMKPLMSTGQIFENPPERGRLIAEGMIKCSPLLRERPIEVKDLFWDVISEYYPDDPSEVMPLFEGVTLGDADLAAALRAFAVSRGALVPLLKLHKEGKSVSSVLSGIDLNSISEKNLMEVITAKGEIK